MTKLKPQSKTPKIKCPHCSELSEYVNYTRRVADVGMYDPEVGFDVEGAFGEEIIYVEFKCPMCDKVVVENKNYKDINMKETLDAINEMFAPRCDMCEEPEDDDGRCECTNKDAHGV